MLEFILNRQAEGKVTKISDIAKKFNMRVADIWDVLDRGFEGYAVNGLDAGATGKAEISVEKIEGIEEMKPTYVTDEDLDALTAACDEIAADLADVVAEDGEGSDAGEYADDMATHEEYDGEATGDDLGDRNVEAEIAQATDEVAKSKRVGFQYGIYPNYETMDAAMAAHPEGIVRLKDVDMISKELKIPHSVFMNAFGGDKLKTAPRNANWLPFTVGTATTRYFSKFVENDFAALQAEPVTRGRKIDSAVLAEREAKAEARKAEREAKLEAKRQKAEKAEAEKAARKAEREAEKAARRAAKAAEEADSGIPLLA